MPYTVFTLLDAFDRDYSTDARTASKLLVAIADAVRWNSGILLKSNMEDIINNAKSSDTNTSQLLTKLYSLFSDDESLQIIGNQVVEQILMDVADTLTTPIKVQNEKTRRILLKFSRDYNHAFGIWYWVLLFEQLKTSKQ